MSRINKRARICALAAFQFLVGLLILGPDSRAQLNERANDPTGLSIPVRRVQVIHSVDASRPGTSMYLQQADPWLAYQMGFFNFVKEWKLGDGLFEVMNGNRPSAAAATSCAMCHNLPFRTPGSGGNVSEPVGYGRNTPHLFGVGLVEMLGQQIRQEMLNKFDRNHNGFIDYPSEAKGNLALIEAADGVRVSFGSLEDFDGDGFPDLNDVIRVSLVDAEGRPKPLRADGTASRLGDPGIAGYNFNVAVFSASMSDHQFPALRLFVIGVLQTVFGLPSGDYTVSNDTGTGRDKRAGDGWAEVSNAGAPQLYLPFPPKKASDGCQQVSEGDFDLFEWFLLNHPAPALGKQDSETARGRFLMKKFGCTSCHVQDWNIKPADKATGMPGDRRFFDLEVKYNARAGKLQGKVSYLVDEHKAADGTTLYSPRLGGFRVRDIFTDLTYHDLGERFYEYFYQNNTLYATKRFRTPPLWGVGSTAPYGYDGRSQTLDDVIRRHGGEADDSERAYAQASPSDRQALIAFLKSLILYQPHDLGTDLNNDGKIEAAYKINGHDVGPERFNPELLFKVSPLYRGWVTGSQGDKYFSYQMLNAEDAYGRKLEALIDHNRDGIADASGCRTSGEKAKQRSRD